MHACSELRKDAGQRPARAALQTLPLSSGRGIPSRRGLQSGAFCLSSALLTTLLSINHVRDSFQRRRRQSGTRRCIGSVQDNRSLCRSQRPGAGRVSFFKRSVLYQLPTSALLLPPNSPVHDRASLFLAAPCFPCNNADISPQRDGPYPLRATVLGHCPYQSSPALCCSTTSLAFDCTSSTSPEKADADCLTLASR